MQTLEGFAKLVQQMRTAQREYFRTRSASSLTTSKRLEATVDKSLQEIQGQRQLLFDGDHEDQ